MANHTATNTIIVTTPEQIAELLGPYLDHLAEKALENALQRAGNHNRMVKYEEARQITGLGKTKFSQAVNDGTIRSYPNGQRGKLFKMKDLLEFSGYQPKTEAQQAFEKELISRAAK